MKKKKWFINMVLYCPHENGKSAAIVDYAKKFRNNLIVGEEGFEKFKTEIKETVERVNKECKQGEALGTNTTIYENGDFALSVITIHSYVVDFILSQVEGELK